LRIASFVEWYLGPVGEQNREFHRLFVETRQAGNVQLAWKHPGLLEGKRGKPESSGTAFHGVSGISAKHVLSDKQELLGRPARLDRPQALLQGAFTSGNGRWEDPCGSLVSEVTLEPGQTIDFVYTLGSTESMADALALAAKYDVATSHAELQRVISHWDKMMAGTELKTGEDEIDVMVNWWLPYQVVAGRLVARCAYYQQGGAFGFRDQLQDSLALLPMNPARTKQQLMTNAEATYDDGGVRHWWHPGTQIFAESRHSDTCLWLTHGVLAYLDETNDLSFLQHDAAYLSRQTQVFGLRGTILDHCLRGIHRAFDLRSKRGLPLILAGDWNDGLSHAGLDGKGESVWVGMFLFDLARRLSSVLDELGESAEATKLKGYADELQVAVNAYGWDGDWYIEGTNDEGRPLGGKECKFGQIYLNPQTWAVISGIAPPDRAQRAMKSAHERLVKPYGALLLTPAYAKVDPWVGYITRYAPGARENGGVYSHASTWAIQAFARMGRHEVALDIFRGMLPNAKQDQEHYAAEPYVMPGNVDGPDSPNEGRAGWTWYTGSAAWMFRTALDYLCGIRATRQGLFVEPKTTAFKSFSLNRVFRGDEFAIEVVSGVRDHMECATQGVVNGHILEPTGGQGVHKVKVTRKNHCITVA